MALILLSCRLPAIAQYGSGQGSYGTLILPNNLVTNGGKGYTLFMQAGYSNPSPGIGYMAFSVPLSPNATFQFATNGTSGTIAYLTNTILWKE